MRSFTSVFFCLGGVSALGLKSAPIQVSSVEGEGCESACAELQAPHFGTLIDLTKCRKANPGCVFSFGLYQSANREASPEEVEDTADYAADADDREPVVEEQIIKIDIDPLYSSRIQGVIQQFALDEVVPDLAVDPVLMDSVDPGFLGRLQDIVAKSIVDDALPIAAGQKFSAASLEPAEESEVFPEQVDPALSARLNGLVAESMMDDVGDAAELAPMKIQLALPADAAFQSRLDALVEEVVESESA